jgi:hypothetical protein
MRTGMIVLAVFAAAWAILGILLAGSDTRAVVVPILMSIALIGWSWRWSGFATSRGPHVGKLVGLWSAIEGVAIIIVGNLLQHFHRPDLVIPAAVIIIGLHFFPLARGIPVRLYHATGAALLLLGLSALLLPAYERASITCFGAALILWSTVMLAVLQIRRTTVSASR